MRFAFTEEQQQIRQAVREALAATCDLDRVRAAWTARDEGLRATLAGLGVLGLDLPDEVGGLGLGPVSWVGVAEEIGRLAAPVEIAETFGTNPALVAAGLHDVAARVAAGEAFVSAFPRGGLAVDADVAELVLVVDGDRLGVVRAPRLTAQRSVDGARRLFRVDGDVDPLDADGAAVLDRAALATAAELLGLASTMLDVAVTYAKDRRQFGKPIGSFQAVQHHLVDAVLKIRFATPAVHHAAWSLETGHPDRAVHVSMAKLYAAEAAQVTARKALQVHGAIGYTTEHHLHLWMKRAWSLARAWGDVGWHLKRVSAHVLGEHA